MILNSVVATLDGSRLRIGGFDISQSLDDWGPQWSVSLLGDASAELAESCARDPTKPILIDVDGWPFYGIVDRVDGADRWGSRGRTARGRGLVAALAAEYADLSTGTNAVEMMASQVIASYLPTGWTLDYAALDWPVPAGAWSWSGLSPIGAIHAFCQQSGLAVLPSWDAQRIRVVAAAQYPPWQYGALTPDVVVSGLVENIAVATPGEVSANGVYVYGGNTGGLLGLVAIDGTAGDLLANAVQSPLATHVYAARQIGSAALAKSYPGGRVTGFRTLIDATRPPLALGSLAEVSYQGAGYRGVVGAIRVAGGRRVDQDITLGFGGGNAAARLGRVVTPRPLTLAGVVSAVYSDGTVAVDVVSGGTMRARGTEGVGARVWVVGGVAEPGAPDFGEAVAIAV